MPVPDPLREVVAEAPAASAEVVAGHERRIATLDPLLPRSHPLPEPSPDDTMLRTPGGVATALRARPDPESFLATWGAADQHRLLARVSGPEPVRSMAALLEQWRDRVAALADVDQTDSEAVLTWPSRDTAMTAPFLAAGLAPGTVIAARAAGRPTPVNPTRARIRPLQPPDAGAAVELWREEVRWDAQFGTVIERPSTVRNLHERLAEALTHRPQWTWVAELGGQIQGLLVLSAPQRVEWVAATVSAAPTAYLDCLVVTANQRGGGLGSALVREAHAALDAAGVAVTLLHYAALSPLSGPFWHRCGYRPLWTAWHVSPASRLSR